MNPKELADEYRNIKAYCRKEAAKSFKHPMAPKPKMGDESDGQEAPPDEQMSDEELAELLNGEE